MTEFNPRNFDKDLTNMTPRAEGFYAGRDWEQARIIKLLEDIAAPYGEGALISADLVKMLIKGEYK